MASSDARPPAFHDGVHTLARHLCAHLLDMPTYFATPPCMMSEVRLPKEVAHLIACSALQGPSETHSGTVVNLRCRGAAGRDVSARLCGAESANLGRHR